MASPDPILRELRAFYSSAPAGFGLEVNPACCNRFTCIHYFMEMLEGRVLCFHE